jgi:hypothetical protein
MIYLLSLLFAFCSFIVAVRILQEFKTGFVFFSGALYFIIFLVSCGLLYVLIFGLYFGLNQ